MSADRPRRNRTKKNYSLEKFFPVEESDEIRALREYSDSEEEFVASQSEQSDMVENISEASEPHSPLSKLAPDKLWLSGEHFDFSKAILKPSGGISADEPKTENDSKEVNELKDKLISILEKCLDKLYPIDANGKTAAEQTIKDLISDTLMEDENQSITPKLSSSTTSRKASKKKKATKPPQKRAGNAIKFATDRDPLRTIDSFVPQVSNTRLMCPIPGCKSFMNPGGMKYHLENFSHEVLPFYRVCFTDSDQNPSEANANQLKDSSIYKQESVVDIRSIDVGDTFAELVRLLNLLPQNSRSFIITNFPISVPRIKQSMFLSFHHPITLSNNNAIKKNRRYTAKGNCPLDSFPGPSMILPMESKKLWPNYCSSLPEDFEIMALTQEYKLNFT